MKAKPAVKMFCEHEGVRRNEDGSIDPVRFLPTGDGKPLAPGADVTKIGAPDRDGWRPITTLYKAGGDGPAQVATPRYRKNYDRIFGKGTVGEA